MICSLTHIRVQLSSHFQMTLATNTAKDSASKLFILYQLRVDSNI